MRARGASLAAISCDPPAPPTTVRWNGGQPVVTDGPFVEAKETIGGYRILDVPDLDAAIAIARSWPVSQNQLVEMARPTSCACSLTAGRFALRSAAG